MHCFWALLFLIILTPRAMGAEFGDGSDGACNFTVALDTDVKNTYNCTSVSISSISVTGSKALIIKSTSSVTVTGNLSLVGGDGGNGSAVTGSSAGSAGAGGFAGGSCPTISSSGNDGQSGGNDGEGKGGDVTTHLGISDAGGGGGGGGRYGTQVLPDDGEAGENDLGGAIAAGAAGSSSYGPESNFENIFLGGSGGGAGGGGAATNAGTPHSGGAGGGGGGAIRIIADGDIVVNIGASINTNGGNGGDGSGNVSAGGGGGSGGAVFLQASGDIRINGTVSADGGSAGDGTFTSNNDGGKGGSGRIRYDDGDGIITGTGSTSPSASINTFVSSSTSAVSSASYDSSISCGRIDLDESEKMKYILLTLIMTFSIAYIVSKKAHHI
ncbi:hypothetical protein BIY24_13460 [Halobacteriovorax marinus]|uniref:hypothetical protein n=1 Tax=Halobacteriovorax marinus TaxID=97084 RepID=UPI000BC30C40|nr:hypothetical protein [Halobacteriovorax marinus]ATH08917.1 hypothetical protein BIY24_13460 [Halobacteriovorax marinus]